jgi:hypothetical protein
VTIKQAVMPEQLARSLDASGCTDAKVYDAEIDGRAYSVILSRDPLGEKRDDVRWHLSVAGQEDVPQWSHLVELAHRLRPGVCFVVGVPPRSWWINLHPHVLHLWETKDADLEAQWRSERLAQKPT